MEDIYTQETHVSVNNRFRFQRDGIYFAHQPIYGYCKYPLFQTVTFRV